MGGWWIIFPIIALIVMLIFVFLMFGRGGGFMGMRGGSGMHNSESRESETPMAILRKRYAKGEITKEEYEEMKRDL